MTSIVPLSKIVVDKGLQTGPFGSQLKAGEYTPYGIPVVMPKDIEDGYVATKSIARIPEHKAEKLGKHRIQVGDILFPRRGELGRIAVATDKNSGWICGTGCLRARLIPEANAKYVHQYLLLPQVNKWLGSNALGQTMLNLNTKIIGELPIYYPEAVEQSNIANVLIQWDTAIEKTEALTAAKRKQFDWLSRHLISDVEFASEVGLLGEIAKIKKGVQRNRDTLSKSGQYPVWNGGITPSGYTDEYNFLGNIVTISEGGNSCGFVNLAKGQFWCGGHCYALIDLVPQVDNRFLYHLLKRHECRIKRLRVGSGLPNIQKRDIEKLKVAIPEIESQRQIANSLDVARTEISHLERLAEKYRTQKHGLMQKLLTGEWRVKGVRNV